MHDLQMDFIDKRERLIKGMLLFSELNFLLVVRSFICLFIYLFVCLFVCLFTLIRNNTSLTI